MSDGDPRSVLAGGGEMGRLMRSVDWASTPVGPVESWPQSLRTALSILLETGFPMYIAWGPDFTQFYNDGYRPILGSKKHPRAMGISTRETFAEIWDIIGPMFEGVMRGTPVTVKDFLLPLDRHGFVEECYFVFSYSPIRQESGDVGGVLVTVTETTERVLGARRLETLRALAEKAQHAHTARGSCELAAEVLAENAADLPFALVYLSDESGRVELAGAAHAETAAADAAQWQVADVAHRGEPRVVSIEDDRSTVRRALVLPIKAAGPGPASGVLVAGLSPRLLFDAAYESFLGLVAGHVGTAITRARALESAKARAEALAAIDRAKTTFFSNVSHEFRTPLTLMLGPAEDALAVADSLPPEDRERWGIVHRNALRLSKLVNALLDFSRIEAGRIEASFEPTNLAKLTAELASMFRSAIERAGLTLRLTLSALDEPAYVDRDMWEKIVLNLLSNALKFTFEGAIEVALQAQGDELELSVRDTGIGIASSDLAHVFQRFHRIKGARARTHEGTGIGLALVAELARLHGGRASVESVEGRGTTFRVIIPRGRAHLPNDRIGAARTLESTATGAAPYVEEALRWTFADEAAADAPTSTSGPRARIVFADDNADMRDYVARLLRERWDVEAFVDGARALAAIRVNPPDLVLADVMMPELDGFGLLRAIRDDARLRAVPVILLSARAGEEATTEGLAAGANDYVVKPFSARELLVRVAATLATSRTAREAAAIEADARDRLYRHFLQAPFPISVLRGNDHVVELANPVALAAWGRDASVLGMPLVEGIPELRGQQFIGLLNDVLRTGVAYQGRGEHVRLARGEGGALEDAYFDFVYAPLRRSDGSVEGVLLSGFDVTRQVLAQKELSRLLAEVEDKERHFRELVENLPELAWTARPDGFVDYYNRRWYEYTGSTPEQMQGWGWRAVHDPEMVDAVAERWQQSLDSGEPFEMEFPLRGADGVLRWFLTRVKPLRGADGAIVRWFGTNTNIDERHRHETFRETFLAILGHDLRNPLNTILTTAKVLGLRADTPAETRRRLDRVVSSGVRMQRMIEQLLDLTRARLAGGIPVTPSEQPLELSPVVTKIVEEIRAANPGRSIELTFEAPCAARVDSDRFEQVVSNLVGNAVTHGDPASAVFVHLAAHNGSVSLVVRNGGRPIDAAFMPVLFNPFARKEKPRGRSEGLGLGLYISERIVNAHGGTIGVSSDAEGTRFVVSLPTGEPA